MCCVCTVKAAFVMTCLNLLKLYTYGNEVQGKAGKGKRGKEKQKVDAVRFGTAVGRCRSYSSTSQLRVPVAAKHFCGTDLRFQVGERRLPLLDRL